MIINVMAQITIAATEKYARLAAVIPGFTNILYNFPHIIFFHHLSHPFRVFVCLFPYLPCDILLLQAPARAE